MSEESDEYDTIAKKNRERIATIAASERQGRSEQVELQLCTAIDRFVTGTTRSDGDEWTVVRLVEESGVPRPTLYRYKDELKLFQKLAALAPQGSGGMQEQNRLLRAALRQEKQQRIEERKRLERIQSVLVQRVHALSLALAQATGQSKLVSLLQSSSTK